MTLTPTNFKTVSEILESFSANLGVEYIFFQHFVAILECKNIFLSILKQFLISFWVERILFLHFVVIFFIANKIYESFALLPQNYSYISPDWVSLKYSFEQFYMIAAQIFFHKYMYKSHFFMYVFKRTNWRPNSHHLHFNALFSPFKKWCFIRTFGIEASV